MQRFVAAAAFGGLPVHRCRFLSAVVGLLFFCVSLNAGEIAPASSSTNPTAPKKLRLFFLTQSSGYRHEVVTRPAGKSDELSPAEKSAERYRHAHAAGAFRNRVFWQGCHAIDRGQELKTLDALVFYTSGDLPLPPARINAIMEWARKGSAIVGIHSATDTFKEFRPYYDVMGATFLRHPWNHGATLTRIDAVHPAVAMFSDGFKWNDELCEYHYFDPKKVRVLLSVDVSRINRPLPHAVPGGIGCANTAGGAFFIRTSGTAKRRGRRNFSANICSLESVGPESLMKAPPNLIPRR